MNHGSTTLEELQAENNILKEMVEDIVYLDDIKENFNDVIEFLLEKSESKPLLNYTIKQTTETIMPISFTLNPDVNVETLIVLKEGCILVSSIHVERDFINFADSEDFIAFIEQVKSLKKQDLIDLSYEEIPFAGLEGIRVTFSARIPCFDQVRLNDLDNALSMVILYNYFSRIKRLKNPTLFWDESEFDFSEYGL